MIIDNNGIDNKIVEIIFSEQFSYNNNKKFFGDEYLIRMTNDYSSQPPPTVIMETPNRKNV